MSPTLLRPAALRTVAKPAAPLLITAYWLRVVNLIAAPETAAKNKALAAYGRLLTEIDPRFYYVYFYLGVCIPYRPSLRQYENAELAAELLELGLKQFPSDVRLRTIYGYTLFEMLHRHEDAAKQFAILAEQPDAPSYARRLSARLLAQARRPDDGLAILEEMEQSCEGDETWECARVRQERQELALELSIQAVEQADEAFTKTFGRHANDLEELRSTGYYSGFGVDPLGEPITITAGKASSRSLRRRFEVYR